MKKVLCLILLLSTVSFLHAQDEWPDPYMQPNSPGYEEVVKAIQFHHINDLKNAYEWYWKAGEKGNDLGYFTCGMLMLHGVKGIIEPDTISAVQTIGYCALRNYAPAQYMMSGFYLDGIGVDEDKNVGIQYLQKSAEQGYLLAKAFLANCYLLGKEGVTRDVNKGLRMTEECANAGHVESQVILGLFYYGKNYFGNEPDFEKARKWLTIAADNGKWLATYYLAYIYAKGYGVEQNFEKAHSFIQEAKQQAERSGELTKETEGILLGSNGELYLMEGDLNKANLVWQQLKENYPEFVENHKHDTDFEFITSMYAKEQNELAQANNNTNIKSKNFIISDIDEKIPENAISGNPIFAVIIANENYKEVEQVPHAIHDGETFKQYCEKTLGIPQNNIRFVEDATLNNIRRELNWISQVMDVYQGEASIIFYYAGHGIPDESNRTSYLLPVDGVGNDVSTGYSLDKLYADLSSKPAKSVVVLLDACFSGAKRDGGMLASTRGVAIKAKQNEPKGNMVVISAAHGDETAYPYEEKGHGMFTYYLLKKLQETKGDVTLGDLADYVTSEVKKRSVVVNGKMQTPIATASNNAADWRNWKLR